MMQVPLLNDRRTWFSSEAFSCERKTLLRCHVPIIPLAQEKAWRVSRAVMHCCQTLKKKVDKRFPCLNVPLKASWQPDYYQVIIRSLDVLVPCCVSVRRVALTLLRTTWYQFIEHSPSAHPWTYHWNAFFSRKMRFSYVLYKLHVFFLFLFSCFFLHIFCVGIIILIMVVFSRKKYISMCMVVCCRK